jgi:large subunit ribosomal protein L3
VGELKVGDMVKADIFTPGDRVDVRGITKGKGFAGVMKRHNFSGHKDSHGTHESFRGPGSISSNTDPARVFKGKRMAGRMGGAQQTARNLKLVRLEAEKNILWVKGAIPGPNGGIVEVRATKKS